MKYAKSEEAREILTRLSKLTFPEADFVTLEDKTKIIEGGALYNVGRIPGDKNHPSRLAVRIFLNSERLTVALLSENQRIEAARLADAAVVFFWKYRIRGKSPTLNFNEAQAKDDIQNVPTLNAELIALEEAWRNDSLLPSAEALEARKKADAKPRVVTPLRKQVEAWASIITKLAEERREDALAFSKLEQRIANLEAHAGQHADNLVRLDTSFTNSLEKLVHALLSIDAKIKSQVVTPPSA